MAHFDIECSVVSIAMELQNYGEEDWRDTSIIQVFLSVFLVNMAVEDFVFAKLLIELLVLGVSKEQEMAVLRLASSKAKSLEIDKIEPFLTTNKSPVSLIEVIPLVTLASVLIEISTRIEDIVDAVQEPGNKADFKIAPNDKTKTE
ncbi:hypothetical protein ACH5RR_041799 [Cinchona calisaya]|uniref:Uncharacterized protein n=1 Tax=Cinchona calisaya TaxID=153742 RepID=A0ABD2XZU2_9GENT